MTRGQRNCNPLNIRRVAGVHWQGERKEVTDKAFVQFESMEWGIRAALCLLNTYKVKYHAICIEDIIRRWAPPSENNTENYIRVVCRLTGFGGKERLTENEWPKLIKAMALHESSITLAEETIARGCELYKLTNKMKKQ